MSAADVSSVSLLHVAALHCNEQSKQSKRSVSLSSIVPAISAPLMILGTAHCIQVTLTSGSILSKAFKHQN